MKNNVNIWLERLAALYLSQMRQAAANEGIQTVHLEILHYLSVCNNYSNTAQALSEYLGQTKGSISQSIKTMEKIGLIMRKPDEDDKRVIKLHLTNQGLKSLENISGDLVAFSDAEPQLEVMVQSLLAGWQNKNNNKTFGVCETCKFNQKEKQNSIRCGLTGAELKKQQTLQICREHQFIENPKMTGINKS